MAKASSPKGQDGVEDEAPRIQGAPTDEQSFGLSPIGTSGLKESGGWIYEEFLPQLSGAKGVKLYAEMEKNSATIGAIRKLVRDLTRQVEWDVVPNEDATDTVAAKRNAEFVNGCRDDMEHSWADLISEAMTMVEYGFAPCEITYKLRRGRGQPAEFDSKYKDGKIGWRSIELRSQDTLDRWEFDRGTRKLAGMWQSDYYGEGRRQNVFIPRERMVNFRTESTKNNPEGRPLFRNAVVSYLRLKHVETTEMIGIERDLTGLPIMEVPLAILKAGTTDAVALRIRNDLERQMGSLKRHDREYLIMPTELGPDGNPTGYKFRLQQSSGAGRIDVSKSKNDYKTDIFQSCLAQFLQLGQGAQGGSRALSSDQTDLFSLAMYSILEAIREAFQRECIDRLCMLNGIDSDCIPQLSFGDIETPNLGQIGTYLTALNTSGVLVPDEELGKHLYKIAGLPWTGKDANVVSADRLVAEALGEGKLSIGDGGASSGDDAEVELLNGAQLASLVQVVEAMAAGTLPKDSAATILTSTLGMNSGVVDGILDPVEQKLLTQGPQAPGSMQPGGGFQQGGPPNHGAQPMPGAPPAEQRVPGDPNIPRPEGGVKMADQLIDEVMKHVIKKKLATLETVTAFHIKRLGKH